MTNNDDKEIKPIAMPGIHDRFYNYLKNILHAYDHPRILDIGAGHGYLVKKLHEDGYEVVAGDLFPEYFRYDRVECKKVDITAKLPFDDQSFDVILAVELMEHVHDHETFFSEADRLLRKNGKLIFTTPNILSLKSRFRFLFSGFFYSFPPLKHDINDGLQHLASLSVDQYKSLAVRYNFTDMQLTVDKHQRTSMLMIFMVPFIRLYCKIKSIPYHIHNTFDLLMGRVLFVSLKKQEK